MYFLGMYKYLLLLFIIAFSSCKKDEGDNTPPEALITAPASGSIVNEIVQIICDATDNEEIKVVSFFVNDTLDSFKIFTPPYIFNWNTNNLENGSYLIKAVALDASENAAESNILTLVVDNTLSFPRSIMIKTISYNLSLMKITFSKSQDDDFDSYKIYNTLTDTSNMVQIGEITNKEDTVFTVDIFDPTQPSWYFVEVEDVYGYSTLSNGYYVLDAPPSVPILDIPNYNNGILNFSWSKSPDADFLKYQLFVSTSSDMFGKNLIVSNTIKNDTTHSFVLSLTDPLSYYQITVEDIWGFTSESVIVLPNKPYEMIKYYGGTDDEKGYAIEQTSDGGYIIVGSSRSYGSGGTDVWMLKVDANGEFNWSKTYGGQENDIGKDVIQTSDGGYIVTGYTKSFSSEGDSDLWLIKTDGNGESCIYSNNGSCSGGTSKWIKTFGTSGDDYGNSVIETSNGDFIATGKSGRIPAIFTVKTNSSGEKLWEKLYGAGPGDRAQCIIERADLGMLMLGKEITDSSADNVCLININADGEEIWHSRYGGAGADVGNYINDVSGGGYIITGSTKSFGNGNWDDAWLIKTSTSGSMEWQKYFGGSYSETGHYVHEKDGGGFIVSGYTESYGQGLYDIWIISTDYTGNEIFSQTIGGSLDDKALGGTKASDGELVIIGFTDSFGNGGEDILLIKMDPNYQP